MTEQIITEQIMTEQSETESVKESRGGYIYKIVFPNGKHYIGLTIRSIEKRMKEHRKAARRGDTQCLYKAIRKYNMVDTFELIEIDTADSIDELSELEMHYIEEYNSFYMDEGNKGYNMTRGGEGGGGYVFTEDVKRLLSEIKKRYFEEHPEARQKMSERRKRYFEEHPEAGKENSERQKQYYNDRPEARQSASERTKQYFNTHPESGKENSERIKQYYKEHPDACKEHSRRMKKYYENPENKKKCLDAKGKNKPFDVFKCDGTYVGTFCYTFECKAYLQKEYGNIPNIQGAKITHVLVGQRKSSKGFIFKYK